MKQHYVSERYTRSLFELAEEKSQTQNVFKELAAVKQAMELRSELLDLLKSPLITRTEKSSLIEGILGAQATELSKDFLNLLVDKNRMDLFPAMIDELQKIIRQKQGIQDITVITAHALHTSIMQLLEKTLEKVTGKDIVIEAEVDPALLGGVQIRIGNRLIDGSVRGKLDILETQLRNVKVV